jgi:hypothetical protein
MRIDPVAVGVDMLFSGGGGPAKRDTFSYELGALVTLIAGQWIHVNLRPYLLVSTDRLCPSLVDIQNDDNNQATTGGGAPAHGSGPLYKSTESAICKVHDAMQMQYTLDPSMYIAGKTFQAFGQDDPRQRFVTVRFMLQGSVEINVMRNLSVYALLEGAPGQGQRQAFTGKFNTNFPTNDFPIYGRAGIVIKF